MTAIERKRRHRAKLREVAHAGDVLVALERAYKHARYEYEQREIRAGIFIAAACWRSVAAA